MGGDAPRRAPDDGLTAIEAAVDVVIVGVLMTAMAALLLLSMESFTPVKDVGNEPEHAAQRVLSRAAARMLVEERCINPVGVRTRSKCLETGGSSFPLPYGPPSPVWSGYPATAGSTVCWMVKAEDLETRPVNTEVPRPDSGNVGVTYTYLNPDERDLECWYHDDAAGGGVGRLLAAMHYPYEEESYRATAKDQDSSDLFMPSWSAEPYRVSLVTAGIGGLGVKVIESSVVGGSDLSLKGWRCVEGADVNPDSQVGSTTTTLPQLRERDCGDAGVWRAADGRTPGAAVLAADLCVLLSPDELRRSRSLLRLDASRGATTTTTAPPACAEVSACKPVAGDNVPLCKPLEVMASPGRR